MTTFRDFVKLYNNKDFVPKLEAMQKIMKFAKIAEFLKFKRNCLSLMSFLVYIGMKIGNIGMKKFMKCNN